MAKRTGLSAAERKVIGIFDKAISKLKAAKCPPCSPTSKKGGAGVVMGRGFRSKVVSFEVVDDNGNTIAYRNGAIPARQTAVAQSKVKRDRHFRVMRNGVNTGSALNGNWKSWNGGGRKKKDDPEFYDLPSNRSDG